MVTAEDSTLILGLKAKLAFLEKELSELQLKYNVGPESPTQATTGSSSLGSASSETTKDPSGEDTSQLGSAVENKNSDHTAGKEKHTVQPDEKTDTEPISRAKVIICKKGPNGETVQIPETSPKSEDDASPDHAFILKKVKGGTSSSVEEDFSEIDSISLGLWNLLKEHLGGHPYHIYESTPTTLTSPWDAIILEWDTLQKAASQEPIDEMDKLARNDLKLLLDTISGGDCGDSKLDKYFKNRETNLKQRSIQFNDLWTIFPPGTLVFGKAFQNQDQVFLVEDYVYTWPDHERSQRKPKPWKLQCWTYDWNGEEFQRTRFVLPFEPFDGHKPITTLPYYPFDYAESRKEIQEKLIDRGKLFRQYCTKKEGSQFFKYAGNAIFSQKGLSGLMQDNAEDSDHRSLSTSFIIYRELQHMIAPPVKKIRSLRTDGQVMVDFASYLRYGVHVPRNGLLEAGTNQYECTCLDCRDNERLTKKYRRHFDEVKVQKKTVWEDEQYMLCPPRVLGYILKDKQWAELQVTLLTPIDQNPAENTWRDRLQLADDNNKEILFNLVDSHISTTANAEADDLQVNDIIPEKGKGLVILLYGPPGVGKTSTAETIAITARKPLFSISVADIGTNPQRVEANLERLFALATSWRAILLIDEADVFLESRGRGHAAPTEKNALVSVFLRVLEYYQGIVFLTTNQIAQFDIAIPSRIHIALRYETLNKEQMKKIFMGFLDPLDTRGLINDYDDIQDWLHEDVYKFEFDGRKIRNIVTTALGLARADRKNNNSLSGKLHKRHLKQAVNNAHAFKTDFMMQMDRYINAQDKMIK